MSRWMSGQTERFARPLSFLPYQTSTCRRSPKRRSLATPSIPRALLIIRLVNLIAYCNVAFVFWGLEICRAEEPEFDKAVYDRAVEFCRGTMTRPMAFDLDHRVLCFDGEIADELDVSFAGRLEQNGLFVVRSLGGNGRTAIALADILRESAR